MKKTAALLVSILLLSFLVLNARQTGTDDTPAQILKKKNISTNMVIIKIFKSKHVLELWADNNMIKSYPCVFGKNPKGDKMQQGDSKTPTGKFSVKAKYPHKDWNKFIWIDYPTAESWTKFSQNKHHKVIGMDAKIGGEIGIHGVPPGTDYMIEQSVNWTLGCISVTNKAIDEIYDVVRPGTAIIIEE